MTATVLRSRGCDETACGRHAPDRGHLHDLDLQDENVMSVMEPTSCENGSFTDRQGETERLLKAVNLSLEAESKNGGIKVEEPPSCESGAVLEASALVESESGDTWSKGFFSRGIWSRVLGCTRLREFSLGTVAEGKCVCRAFLDNYVMLSLFVCVGLSINVTCLKILSTNISIFQIVAIRSVFCFLVLFVLCLYKGIPLTEPRSKVPFFILRGILGAAAFLCVAVSTFELPLSESSFMNNSYPAVTAVFSWMIGMDKLGVFSWSGVVGCTVGNALMAHPPFLFGGHEDWGMDRAIGIISTVCGNLFYASMFIILRFLGKDVNSFMLAAYMHLISFLFCLPFLFIGFPMAMNTRHSPVKILCFLGTSVLGILVQPSLCRALQVGSPTKASAIMMTSMLLSAAFGMIALSEKTMWFSKLGAAVILVSVLLVVLQRSPGKGSYQPISTTEEKEEIQLTIQTVAK